MKFKGEGNWYFFDHELAWRTYDELGFIRDALKNDNNEVFRVTNAKKRNIKVNKSDRIHLISISKIHEFLLSVHSFAYWFLRRKDSISISTRLNILSNSESLEMLRINRAGIALRIAKMFPSFSLRTPLYISMLFIPKIHWKLFFKRPETIFMITTGGSLSFADQMTTLCRLVRIPVVQVFDNWDGIFTKAVMSSRPSKLLVWGEKGRQEAINVHQMKIEDVVTFGSPRTRSLIKNHSTNQRCGTKIFFAGGSTYIDDEIEELYFLANLVTESIIYLPHPKNYGEIRKISQKLFVRNVEIPDFVIQNQSKKKKLPPLKLYEEIFQNSFMTISPLSTLALESGLLGIPTIVLDSQIKGQKDLGTFVQGYGHLKTLSEYSIFTIVSNKSQFLDAVKLMRSSKHSLSASSLEQMRVELLAVDYQSSESVKLNLHIDQVS